MLVSSVCKGGNSGTGFVTTSRTDNAVSFEYDSMNNLCTKVKLYVDNNNLGYIDVNNDMTRYLHRWNKISALTGKVTCSTLGMSVGVNIYEVIITAKLDNNDNVAVSVHIPYVYHNERKQFLVPELTKIRAGYFQNSSNGGFADFKINNAGDSFSLHNAYLNGNDVSSTTTWTIYYRWTTEPAAAH